MDFTLDQLKALDAIARTGSFAAAGADLHKVPSAVSYLIRTLESAVGVPLFDRSRRQARLTREGRRVLEGSRSVLAQAQDLHQMILDLQGGWESELHVVVDGALPMKALTQCLKRFAAPDVPTRLHLEVAYRQGVLHRFVEGPADLAVVLGLEQGSSQDGHLCTPLPPLELVLVVAPDHPMAGVRIDDPSTTPHVELVVRDSARATHETPNTSFLGSRQVVHLSDFHSKRAALLECGGFGWVPTHLVAADLESGGLELVDCEPNRWTYHPQVVTRETPAPGRAAALFLSTLKDVAKPEASPSGTSRRGDPPPTSRPDEPPPRAD